MQDWNLWFRRWNISSMKIPEYAHVTTLFGLIKWKFEYSEIVTTENTRICPRNNIIRIN